MPKKLLLGLTPLEAQKLLQKHGLNELEEKKNVSLWGILLEQIKSPLIYILIFAGLVSAFLKEYTDALVIFLAVVVNSLLGLWQEVKAEKALMALRSLIVPHTWVIRNGLEEKIQASQLVPGDIVVLKTGQKVPADGIILEEADLYLNEAILTGESEPIRKNVHWQQNQAFMGTVVVAGRGVMRVLQTGKKTKMGKIAQGLSQTVEEETPLKLQIKNFSQTLAIIMVFICLFILVQGLLKKQDFEEIFTLAVAVAVAAIPEGLVIAVTTILVLGMQRLLKAKTLVRRLLAAETLGSVNCICLDKTGTLTEGKMKVIDYLTDNKDLLFQASLLCNNLTNPLEQSLYSWAKIKLKGKEDVEEEKRLDEIPFSSVHKYIATLYEDYFFVSGAPEKIIRFSFTDKTKINFWLEKLNQFTRKGYRVIAFACRPNKKGQKEIAKQDVEKNLQWLGLVCFADPVRKNVAGVLQACQKAGIQVKVITGDYSQTAVAIANKAGLVNGNLNPDQVMEGEELSRISQDELSNVIDQIALFCRTTPEQKIKLVQTLQDKGKVVAMMGDGVNDSLALKKADIGIVVGEASEVAKETADMVLLDSNFQTIIKAISLGRSLFENIKKVVLYLLTSSFSEMILISGSLVVGLPSPLLAVQILWVNLVQDGLPSIALAFEDEEGGMLDQPPRPRNAQILDKEMKTIILGVGLVTDLILLIFFWFLMRQGIDLAVARTIVFMAIGVNSIFYIWGCKSLRQNLWQIKILDNFWLILSFVIGFVLLFMAIYLPFMRVVLQTTFLPLWAFGLILLYSLGKLAGIEAVKFFYKK